MLIALVILDQNTEPRKFTSKSVVEMTDVWKNSEMPYILDLRPYRREKVKKGNRAIRERRYDIRPDDKVLYANKIYTVHGMQNQGTVLSLNTTKAVPLSMLQPKTGKDKEELPITVGQRLALKGKKEKHEVLNIKEEIAIMRWYVGVKPNKVRRLTYSYGGWKIVK